jgi:hypothetical protein
MSISSKRKGRQVADDQDAPKRGRPALGYQTIGLRLSPDLIKLLKLVVKTRAKKGEDVSSYVRGILEPRVMKAALKLGISHRRLK